MPVTTTKTFKSGNSEAVRLPRDLAFGEGVELVAVRSGDVLTLYRASRSVSDMIAALQAMPKPPSVQERDEIEIPDRPGL